MRKQREGERERGREGERERGREKNTSVNVCIYIYIYIYTYIYIYIRRCWPKREQLERFYVSPPENQGQILVLAVLFCAKSLPEANGGWGSSRTVERVGGTAAGTGLLAPMLSQWLQRVPSPQRVGPRVGGLPRWVQGLLEIKDTHRPRTLR